MNSKIDRRSSQRVVATLPVRVRGSAAAEVRAQTRDVSTNGVFLYSESRLAEGADVELVLILPPELTSGENTAREDWLEADSRGVNVKGVKFPWRASTV